MLRSIYSQERNIEKFLDLTDRTELTQADCEAIATMFQAEGRPNDALAWIERGIQMEKPGRVSICQQTATSWWGDAPRSSCRSLAAAAKRWTRPGRRSRPVRVTFTYEELLRYVPKAEHQAWHEKAMAAAGQGNPNSVIELWLSTKEIERLVETIRAAPAIKELEGLSHYVTEPAAERLAETHPGVAAKVFRALCVRDSRGGQEPILSMRPCRTSKKPGDVTKRLGSTSSGRHWWPKFAGAASPQVRLYARL